VTSKDPGVRGALLEAAARVVAEEGGRALSARRLADEVGTSTMAIYTYFDGMSGLARAVREEGFARLGSALDQVAVARDQISELFELGFAYMIYAAENSHFYRYMFMERPPGDDLEIGLETFARIVDTADRAVGSGRIAGDPVEIARECWLVVHGAMSLQLVGILTWHQALASAEGALVDVVTGRGPRRDVVRRSMRSAKARMLT
jgi:AcrR family transcriptional regulator